MLKPVHPQCFGCGILMPAGVRTPPGRTCMSCREASFLYAFFSPFSFEQEYIRELVHALKYRRVRDIGAVLASLLFEYCSFYSLALPKDAIMIPIPLHKKRERTRGFNQAEIIARHFGEYFGVQPYTGVIKKIKPTVPQVELLSQERKENVKGVFCVTHPEVVRNRTIILLDDVKTTGATIEEAAKTLKEAGAKYVWAITVAH
ncbi:MAG: ComF family protein [Candidatus Colwellbacteria bacterium]|nr:ComF family protein [Candidatus Colwellbacteria bacterium]